jgi:hypothetical protein
MTDSNPDADRLIALLSGRAVAADTFSEADWQRVVDVAQRQNVAPLLYAKVKEYGISPPPATAQELRGIYLASFARNARLLQEAATIMGALRAAGIPVIPLKGVCLAEAVYGNIALRPMADMDLLVMPHDLAKALAALRTLDYAAACPFDIETERQINAHLPQLSKRGGVKLELHWTIASPRHPACFSRDDLAQLWVRAVAADVVGVPVLTLSPTDLLLHLCWHVSAQHRFDGTDLRNFVDIDVVCRRYGDAIDWQQFAARANAWHVANGVRLALQLAKEWTDAAIPDSVLAALDASLPDDLITDWVRHKILSGSSPALRGDLARLEGNRGIAGRLGALRDALFPSRVVIAAKYHTPATSWRILGCYLLRFRDLWVRYSHAMWQLLRRDQRLTAEARQEARLREYLGWDKRER